MTKQVAIMQSELNEFISVNKGNHYQCHSCKVHNDQCNRCYR